MTDIPKIGFYKIGIWKLRTEFVNVLVSILCGVLLWTPLLADAAINNLNGQTGQTQTFATSTTFVASTSSAVIFVTSTSNVHKINWTGILQPAQGGTGASSFATGSIAFFQGGKFSENNSNLFWDDSNLRFGIGTASPQSQLHIATGTLTVGGLATSTIAGGTSNSIIGSDLVVRGGDLFLTASGQDFQVLSVDPDMFGGTVVVPDGQNLTIIGGQLNFGGTASTTLSSDTSGQLGIQVAGSGNPARLDSGLITGGGKTFTFPDFDGTFGLLQGEQTFTGFKSFLSASSSTVKIGSSTATGCLILGDSDGAGVTYITVNDGVLTATTTKPNFCQ